MDLSNKIKKEIERLERLIADSEAIMDKIPNHLRPYQETALELHKDYLAKLEMMLRNDG